MTGTIESVHEIIENRFDILLRMKDTLYKSKLSIEDKRVISMYEQQLQVIRQRFMSVILHFTTRVNRPYPEFINEINLANTNNDLNLMVSKLNLLAIKYDTDLDKLLDDYSDQLLDLSIDDINNNICADCKIEFTLDEEETYLCKKCGIVKSAAFESKDYKVNELGCRNTNSRYNELGQFKDWFDRIQATASIKIDEAVYQAIIKIIQRDRVPYLSAITCEKIRAALKEIDRAYLNPVIPIIHAELTEISPPQLTDVEKVTIEAIFIKVIEMYRNKQIGKTNTKYYPYFIYKIVEITLLPGPRRDIILSYIHLQSKGTLYKNDTIWFQICDEFGYEKITTSKRCT